MKKQFILLALLSALQLQAQTLNDTVKLQSPNDKMVIDPGMPADSMAVRPAVPPSGMAVMTDTGFIRKNILDNLLEIELSKGARYKATTPLVKRLAAQMITDHTAALNDFRQLAARRHVSTAANPSEAMQSMPPVTVPQGGTFDATWASLMLGMHEAKIAELQKILQETSDAELRTISARVLQKVQMHRDMLLKVPGIKKGVGPNDAVH